MTIDTRTGEIELKRNVDEKIRDGRYDDAIHDLDAWLEETTNTPDPRPPMGPPLMPPMGPPLMPPGWFLRRKAQCLCGNEELPAAIRLAGEAVGACTRAGDEAELADAHAVLGVSYAKLALYGTAVEHLKRAYAFFGDREPAKAGALLNNIGNIFFEMGSIDEARENFDSAVAHRDTGVPDRTVAIALGNLGRCAVALGEYSRAVECHERSIAMFASLGHTVFYAHALRKLADAHVEFGAYTAAEPLYRESLDVMATEKRPLWRHEILVQLGILYLKIGRYDDARRALETGLREAPTSDSQTRILANDSLARVFEALRRRTAAFESLKESTASKVDAALITALADLDLERVKREKELSHVRNVELAHALEELERVKNELEARNRELAQIAVHDSLTGAFNRRNLTESLPIEIERVRRYDEPLSIAMIDLDGFKQINDEYSHVVGDEVLRRIVLLMGEHLRRNDRVVRYGGDEFVVIFPHTRFAEAEIACEKLRSEVADYAWADITPRLRVSISIGIAEASGDSPPDELISRADERMYLDKEMQRGQPEG